MVSILNIPTWRPKPMPRDHEPLDFIMDAQAAYMQVSPDVSSSHQVQA